MKTAKICRRKAAIAIIAAAALLLAALYPRLEKHVAPRLWLRQVVAQTGQAHANARASRRQALGLDAAGQGPLQWHLALQLQDETSTGPLGAALTVNSDAAAGAVEAEARLLLAHTPVYRLVAQLRAGEITWQLPAATMGAYRLETTTLGQSWNASALAQITGVLMPQTLGFDLLAALQAGSVAQDGLADALLQDATVKPAGSQSTVVNGNALRCEVYAVTVAPQAAAQALGSFAGGAALQGLAGFAAWLAEAGWACPWADEAQAAALATFLGLAAQQPQKELYLTLYVHSGSVVRWEALLALRGDTLTIAAELGDAAVPDGALTLSAAYGGHSLRWEHRYTAPGAFTAQLALGAAGDAPTPLFSAALAYEPDSPRDNLTLECRLGTGGPALRAAGTLRPQAAEGVLAAELDRVTLEYGQAVHQLTASFRLGPFTGRMRSMQAADLLALDADALENLAAAVQKSLEGILGKTG